MKNQYFSVSLVLFVALLLTACGGTAKGNVPAPTPASQITLKVSGSGSVVSVLAAIKPKFEADTPGYRLEVLEGSGTGGGVQGVTQGILDVAAMARPSTDEEAAEGLKYVEFGRGAVAVFIHPDVSITNLTAAQVAAIFSGEITNWSKVGGPDERLILYVRDEKDASTKALRKDILGETPFSKTAQVLTSQRDMQSAVAGTPFSVGIGAWPSALASRVAVESPALDNIVPGDPRFPMLEPLGIGFKAERQADVQPLSDWLLSEKGQAALKKLGVIISQ